MSIGELKLYQPPVPKRKLPCPLVSPAKLLHNAELTWESDRRVDHLLCGWLCRTALESHLRLLCQKLSLPNLRYDPFALRLHRNGHLTYEQLNEVRAMLDRGNRAVHNQPFTAEEAQRLYDEVLKFVG